MTTTDLLPLPHSVEAPVTAPATPGERLGGLRVADMAARFDYRHHDSVRKRVRDSWPGPGPRWHAHRDGDPHVGELLFKPAVADVIASGGSYLEQVAACAAAGGCPEAATQPALQPVPSRAAFTSPGRRR